MSGLKLIAGPAVEPVTLAEAKAFLRFENDLEDALLSGLIRTARQTAEAFLSRALTTQHWTQVRDAWPRHRRLALPLPPLQSVDEVRVIDALGTPETVPLTSFDVIASATPGVLVVKSGASVPTPGPKAGGIEIDFTAGYGDSWNDVPEAIRQGILVAVAHLFENRVGGTTDIPPQARALWAPYRVTTL